MKKQFFYSMLAAAMLVSCSSEKVTENSGGTETAGDGFIAVNLNLPSVPSTSTRAANDNYDDGLANEYAIKTAALILFEGSSTDPDAATFKQTIDVYSLLEKYNDVDKDNITTSYQIVAKVNPIASGNKLFGLAVFNYTGVFNAGTSTFTTSGGTYALTSNTFGDFKSQVFGNFAGIDQTANGFFMTNAVLSTDKATNSSAPSSTNLQTLVNLTPTTYATEAEARTHPAGSIYVERAVAKATLGVKSGVTTIQSTTPITINAVTWAINNTEPTSYIVRKPHTASIAYSSEAYSTPYYRFLGNVQMGETTIQPVQALYRTYWCEDPQYSPASPSYTHSASTFNATGTSNPQYCNENTFDVAHQTYENTTRAVVKVTTTGGTFYTDNGENQQYSLDAINSRIKAVALADLTFKNAIEAIYTGGSLTLTADMFKVTWGSKDSNGRIKVTGITVNTSDAGWGSFASFTGGQSAVETAVSGNQADVITGANTLHKVLEYTNGDVYYEARFMHFADPTSTHYTTSGAWTTADTDLAPWNKWETTNKPSSTTAYPANTKTAEENYLGRWGMVRNNWYDVEITAFKKIGLPVDPSTTISNPSTPDDNIESNQYLSVKINVLSWAKRTQSWTF